MSRPRHLLSRGSAGGTQFGFGKERPGEGNSQGPEQCAEPVSEDEMAGKFLIVGGAELLMDGNLDEGCDEP